MIKSMTGYGRAKMLLSGYEITVELRAVNHRYLDLNIKTPRIYGFLDDSIKEVLSKTISRGKIDIYVTIVSPLSEDIQILLNEPVLNGYMQVINSIKEKYPIADDVSVMSVARLPEVLTTKREEADAETIQKDVATVLEAAIAEFNQMRGREGQKLYDDLMGRAETIEKWVCEIEQRSPVIVKEYREKLQQRMNEILLGNEADPQRILTEAAIFADKTAVDEETVRIKSHLSQLRKMLKESIPVGRKLDFLVQELNRETNTIGSKVHDYEIAHMVVELKSEIEKIREQVQNIE